MDGRSNALVRPSGVVDRDREMLRPANSGAVQGEDRNLSIGDVGWEKSKMKKKRSGIKPDVSPSTMSTKPIDGYRETKQGMQQRPIADTRSRLNNESHGFRYDLSSINVNECIHGNGLNPNHNWKAFLWVEMLQYVWVLLFYSLVLLFLYSSL